MSDDILTAAECHWHDDYLQSPVDDLYFFYHTMQWAAVFHNQEFAAKDIPFELKLLCKNLLGEKNDRLSVTTKITTSQSIWSYDYGSVVANCHPVLQAWYGKLADLRNDWEDCQHELKGQEIKAEIYIPLFLTFAVRGVSELAEIVHKYTKDMD